MKCIVLFFHSSHLGESPPHPPRPFFGREELVEEIVGLAENLQPIALIGAGGIGKTAIALAVLHHNRIKERFGDDRRFIRCDRFPPSHAHFLACLSKAIGAGIENPEDLSPLRPLLSSKEMLIVLDNAESILDPQGTNHQEIYAVVDELCQFKTICLCITSRITTVPQYCRHPQIPMLSMGAATDIFYSVYHHGGRSEVISDLVEQLDFHALSITLLATTASDNTWDFNRLSKEWDMKRSDVLQTEHSGSLAATIEFSLASPAFRNLGPNARDLLGVVAFFPHGVDERNLGWMFPMISDGERTFDGFCILSLAYRSKGFITMLAPFRDHLCPRDPKSSPLLCEAKDRYFTRLSVDSDPNHPKFQETQWIKSEDVNVEHILDVFISIDTNAVDVWDACDHFLDHLRWHKPRQTVLGPKIEGLPDDHPSKPGCLFKLSLLFGSVGNYTEEKRLLTRALALERERWDGSRVARALRSLSHVNLMLGLRKEGINQAEEASEMYQQLGDTMGQAECSHTLAVLLIHDDRLDAAEDTILRAIRSLPEEGQDFLLCRSHHILGEIYRCKREKEKSTDHFETALRIASPFNWQGTLFLIHYSLATLLSDEDEFDDANTHIEQAKSYTSDNTYDLGRAMGMQALIWYHQHRLEDAKSEALCALEVYEKLGAARDVGDSRELLQIIEREIGSSGAGGEFSEYDAASHPH